MRLLTVRKKHFIKFISLIIIIDAICTFNLLILFLLIVLLSLSFLSLVNNNAFISRIFNNSEQIDKHLEQTNTSNNRIGQLPAIS